MSDGRPLVGIDVGSSAVKVVVAEADGDDLRVLGCGQAGHDGARRGVISNLSEVIEAVATAAGEAEAMASVPVESAMVGIGGIPVRGMPSRAPVPVTGRDGTVSAEDQARALQNCAHFEIPSDFRVLRVIPCGFEVDGQEGILEPVGLPGTRLVASAYVLSAAKTHADAVEHVVNRASLMVQRMEYEPLAAAEAVLDSDERELGCLLLDIGYATSEWVLFSEGAVIACGAVPVGGRHFSSDLATMLNTTTSAAEQLKRRLGASLEGDELDGEAVEVPALGGEGNQVHPARFAAEVLIERGRDLLVRVHQELVSGGVDRLPRAGVVITGGGARLDGLEDLAEAIFGLRARVGSTRGLLGEVEPVSGPEWTVACGLVIMQHRPPVQLPTVAEPQRNVLAWLRRTLNEFFELGGAR